MRRNFTGLLGVVALDLFCCMGLVEIVPAS
jgi:hypothetical protein